MLARWALMLEDFDYIVEHRPGIDALSRKEGYLYVC